VKPEIELKLTEAAIDSMGIYPASYDGVERTEWQNGWNKAVMDLGRRQSSLYEWYEQKLSEDERVILDELLIKNVVRLHPNENDVVVYVICNDLFMWACADTEEVAKEEWGELLRLAGEFNDTGEFWCCKKRDMKPQKPVADGLKKAGLWNEHWEKLRDNPTDVTFY
jgi:hypothetical protein